MIVRNMRWGYDGGGVACGPVEGNSIVELVVTHDDAVHFIVVCRMCEYELVYVSPFSLFDKLIHANNSDVDLSSEYEEAKNISIECSEYDINNGPGQSIKKSKLYKAINLARHAMKEYYSVGTTNEDEDIENCKKFISKYIDQDISKMRIPAVKYD